MKNLEYTKIKDEKQYIHYCNKLEILVNLNNINNQDEIELLELLIENWDDNHNPFFELDPIQILNYLMKEHNLKANDLTNMLNISKSTISKMLNYQKGISKESIRKLAEYFKVSQNLFNRPYKLVNIDINRSKRSTQTI